MCFWAFIIPEKIDRGWEIFLFNYVFLIGLKVFWVEQLVYW
jgi:hypothetical protein